jgi:hypothetical protein
LGEKGVLGEIGAFWAKSANRLGQTHLLFAKASQHVNVNPHSLSTSLKTPEIFPPSCLPTLGASQVVGKKVQERGNEREIERKGERYLQAYKW